MKNDRALNEPDPSPATREVAHCLFFSSASKLPLPSCLLMPTSAPSSARQKGLCGPMLYCKAGLADGRCLHPDVCWLLELSMLLALKSGTYALNPVPLSSS